VAGERVEGELGPARVGEHAGGDDEVVTERGVRDRPAEQLDLRRREHLDHSVGRQPGQRPVVAARAQRRAERTWQVRGSPVELLLTHARGRTRTALAESDPHSLARNRPGCSHVTDGPSRLRGADPRRMLLVRKTSTDGWPDGRVPAGRGASATCHNVQLGPRTTCPSADRFPQPPLAVVGQRTPCADTILTP
jgi:hypothetical protein